MKKKALLFVVVCVLDLYDNTVSKEVVRDKKQIKQIN